MGALGEQSPDSTRKMENKIEKENHRKNTNRGYQKLRVWQSAVEYYIETCRIFKNFPFEMKKICSQQISAVDSIHRNIAEGYSRRSIREYINFLYIALASLAESVSSLQAYKLADQITPENFKKLDSISYYMENSLLRLIQELEKKRTNDDSIDTLIPESNDDTLAPSLHSSIPPSLQA